MCNGFLSPVNLYKAAWSGEVLISWEKVGSLFGAAKEFVANDLRSTNFLLSHSQFLMKRVASLEKSSSPVSVSTDFDP